MASELPRPTPPAYESATRQDEQLPQSTQQRPQDRKLRAVASGHAQASQASTLAGTSPVQCVAVS